MIPKIVTNTFDFGEVATSLVPLHSRGVDQQWMTKHASNSIFHDVIQTLRPDPKRSIIHVIALGDEEIYGPNRNCDGFSREDNVTAHRSFKDIGHVFKNHKNDDPFKAVGDVIATAHNKQMSRVQLLLGLDNDKCRREVDALDKGQDVPVSMGSMQDYDVCSICQHKAPTAADHCHHIKFMLGQVLDDGRKVYMKNPNPKYFDISLVFKPADRIAYTLKKVAADSGQALGGHDLAEIYGIRPAAYGSKTATLRALASIRKEIPTTLRPVPESVDPETAAELKKVAKVHGIQHLLAFLTANGWLLAPQDFADVIGHKNPEGCGCAAEEHPLADIMDDLSETEVSSFDPPAYTERIPLSADAVEDLDSKCSMLPAGANARVIRISLVGRQSPKVAASRILDYNEARGFATLYGHYKVAFASKHSRDNAILRTVAATF